MSPAISLREAERGAQIGLGRDPQWHQRTDMFATYDGKDCRIGLNAAQTNAGCSSSAYRCCAEEVTRELSG